MLRNVVIGIAVAYFLLCAAVFFFQRSLIYFPRPRTGDYGATIVALQGATERVLVSTRPKDGARAVIYFGGNAEDVSVNMPGFLAAFPDSAIYLLHYRGYGGSSGKPSEAALFADALALLDEVRSEHSQVVLVGRSLGSGLAVHVASQRPVARLVLITPFDSLQELAVRYYPYLPVRWLLRDKYESWRFAPQVTAPTLIIAAEQDEIVPRASTELLQSRFAAGLATLKVVSGTHNTVSESAEFMESLRTSVERGGTF